MLVVAAVAMLVVRGTAEPLAGGPGSSDSPVPGTASPSERVSVEPAASAAPSDEPSASTDADTLAELAEIEEQVIAIRGLEAADIGPAEIITRAELADELQVLFDAEYPPEERERDNIALRALGLLEPDQDIAELQLELLGDQVLGFYDDVEKRMVVVSDAGLDVEARITHAHEYTHALQDAAFGLDTLETDTPGEDDRGLARTSLIEGDATVTMVTWMLQHLGQEEILAYFSSAEVPDTTGIPSWMVAQLAFPYETGLTWTTELGGGDPTNPDFTEIDAAYSDPPGSTEQVIDFDKWEPREDPDVVEPIDLAGALGQGWEEVDATPIGQATMSIMLEYFEVSAADAREAAEGWGGDRATVVTGPDEAFAVAWLSTWDTPGDADEFVAAYRTAIDQLDFPATVTELPTGEVLVAHASTDELLDQTVDAAS